MNILPAAYYAFGLVWLVSGIATGWLKAEGHPIGIALWIATAAAAWPWLVFKILRDLTRGQGTTDFQ